MLPFDGEWSFSYSTKKWYLKLCWVAYRIRLFFSISWRRQRSMRHWYCEDFVWGVYVCGTGDSLLGGKPSRYITSYLGQLSLAIPPWVGLMRISDGYSHRQGRKRRVLQFCVADSPATRTNWFKACCLKLSRPSGWSGSFTSLVETTPVQSAKMSTHTQRT